MGSSLGKDVQVEDALLLLDRHRVDEGLVTVSEIGRSPSGSFCDALVGPGAVFQRNRLERAGGGGGG